MPRPRYHATILVSLLPVLAGLMLAGQAEASIVRIGPCVNPHCNVTPPNSGFVAVATGNYHSMGLRSNGSVAAWGMCDVGQCNAGDSHSLALRNGTIVAWGSNEAGELQIPAPNSGFVAIAAGLLHNLALKSNGSIVGWGSNIGGESIPPAPNTNWVAIAAGGYYSIGLKSDGSIRRWGCNGPCAVPSPNTGFVAVSTHFYHSLAVRKDGSIVAWGTNDYGQLNVPAPNTGFVAVAAGDHFSLGLKSDGSLIAWGQLDQDDVALPNRGYLAMTANKGLGDALKSDMSDPTFSEAPPISTSGIQTPTAVAADIDGDGDQDIVSAEYGVNVVAWYENNGTSPPVWIKRLVDSSASGPITVAVADVDGDGDLDVFSANFNEEGVAWYENSGATPPSWTKRLISGIAAWGVYAADVDGDSDIDGIGGNRWDNTSDHIGVEWYENNGASPPSFTVRKVSAGFIDAASVYAADLDGDGDSDILSVDVFEDVVYWFENDGGHPPAWTQRTVTATTDDVWSVFAADLDHDGDTDVLSASSQDDKIAWYENDGSRPPLWTPHIITTSAPQAIAVFAKDLDGDSDLDVVSGAWENEIAWYESDGGSPPSFTRRVISHDCSGPEGVFAARLDPDADVDILAACDINGTIQWYPNNANFMESDGDGVRDDLDCAPADATAFALPGEVRNVAFETAEQLRWSAAAPSAGTGTAYQVLRGDLVEFPVGSGGEICLDPGMETSLREEFEPAAGAGRFYLIRGTNECGAGSWGFESSGAERTSAICP